MFNVHCYYPDCNVLNKSLLFFSLFSSSPSSQLHRRSLSYLPSYILPETWYRSSYLSVFLITWVFSCMVNACDINTTMSTKKNVYIHKIPPYPPNTRSHQARIYNLPFKTTSEINPFDSDLSEVPSCAVFRCPYPGLL